MLIPESLFPLPHGIEAYAQANSIAVENFRGYVADLCGILPLYVVRIFTLPPGVAKRDRNAAPAVHGREFIYWALASALRSDLSTLHQHFSPIGKLQEEGAQRSTEDSLLYVNVLAASSFKHIYVRAQCKSCLRPLINSFLAQS